MKRRVGGVFSKIFYYFERGLVGFFFKGGVFFFLFFFFRGFFSSRERERVWETGDFPPGKTR